MGSPSLAECSPRVGGASHRELPVTGPVSPPSDRELAVAGTVSPLSDWHSNRQAPWLPCDMDPVGGSGN